jgi:hypothetical protein
MSVGFITRRTRLSFNSSRTCGLYQPGVRYAYNDGHVGNFGQKRNTAPEA